MPGNRIKRPLTITIDVDLHASLRRHAFEENRTMGAIVEEALIRMGIHRINEKEQADEKNRRR